MKKIIFILFLFSIFTSLHAYSKKIVFSTFTDHENANKNLEKFEKTQTYKTIYSLSKKHNFKIYTRKSGKYFIVVAEPLNSQKLLTQTYALAQVEYKDAYYIDSEISQLSKEKKKVEKETKKIELETTLEKKEDFNISSVDILLYFTIVLILGVIIFFYIKLKRIYDQY